jgi:hypothetical protein
MAEQNQRTASLLGDMYSNAIRFENPVRRTAHTSASVCLISQNCITHLLERRHSAGVPSAAAALGWQRSDDGALNYFAPWRLRASARETLVLGIFALGLRFRLVVQAGIAQ